MLTFFLVVLFIITGSLSTMEIPSGEGLQEHSTAAIVVFSV